MTTFDERAALLERENDLPRETLDSFTIDYNVSNFVGPQVDSIIFDDGDYKTSIFITHHGENHFDVRSRDSLGMAVEQRGVSIWGLQSFFEYITTVYTEGYYWAFRHWAIGLGINVK